MTDDPDTKQFDKFCPNCTADWRPQCIALGRCKELASPPPPPEPQQERQPEAPEGVPIYPTRPKDQPTSSGEEQPKASPQPSMKAVSPEEVEDALRAMAEGREPFASVEDGLRWFDNTYRIIERFAGKSVVRPMAPLTTDDYIVNERGEIEITPKNAPMTYGSFRETYGNRTAWNTKTVKDLKGNETTVREEIPLPSLWIRKGKNRYAEEVFFPLGANEHGRPLRAPDGPIYNLWRGFKCQRVDVSGMKLSEACPNIHTYLWAVAAAEHAERFNYLLRWSGDLFLNPRRLAGRTAVVLKSPGRAGANTFFRILWAIVGRDQGFETADHKQMFGDFNGHMENKLLWCLGDMSAKSLRGPRGDEMEERRTKLYGRIDDPTFGLHHKHLGIEQRPNYGRGVITSNRKIIVPTGAGYERFAGMEISEAYKNNKDGLFTRIYDALAHKDGPGGELDRFFSFLTSPAMTEWLTDFSPQLHRPHSDLDDIQLEASLEQEAKILIGLANRGNFVIVDKSKRPATLLMSGVGRSPQTWGEKGCAEIMGWGDIEYVFVTSEHIRAVAPTLNGIKEVHLTDTAFGRDVMNPFALTSDDRDKMQSLSRHSGQRGRWWPQLKYFRRLCELRFYSGKDYPWEANNEHWNA